MDIYSIGVLLLEIFCGRKNVKLSVEDENQIRLADGAYDKYKEGRLDLLVKNDEEAINDMKRVEKFVMTALVYSGCSIAKTFHEERSASVGRCHGSFSAPTYFSNYFSIINYQKVCMFFLST